jgi:hypothetical protein
MVTAQPFTYQFGRKVGEGVLVVEGEYLDDYIRYLIQYHVGLAKQVKPLEKVTITLEPRNQNSTREPGLYLD